MAILKMKDFSEGRCNNLDFLRVVLACLVIIAHCGVFIHAPEWDLFSLLTNQRVNFGRIALESFFLISGFLITASWIRCKGLGDFMVKRVLRIYPAFILACVVCLFVVAPICVPEITQFYQNLRWPSVIKDILILNKIDTPPLQLNGSLWSIKIEFECYLLVAFLGIISILSRPTIIFGLLGVSYIGFIATSYFPDQVSTLPLSQTLLRMDSHFHFGTCFIVGILIYLFRDIIPFHRNVFFAIVGLFLIGCITRTEFILLPICLGYIVFYFGFHPKIRMNNFAKHGDFSYGIYLYGWPVQMVIAKYMGTTPNPYLYLVLCLGLATLIAFLSWHLVEKPALSFARRPVSKRKPVEDSEVVTEPST